MSGSHTLYDETYEQAVAYINQHPPAGTLRQELREHPFVGAGKLLRGLAERRLRFIAGRWWIASVGKHAGYWEPVDAGGDMAMAEGVTNAVLVELIGAAMAADENEDRAAARIAWGNVRTFQSAGAATRVLNSYKHLSPTRSHDLNADPYLFGVLGQVIDLHHRPGEAGFIQPVNPDMMLAGHSSAVYDPSAACPLWEWHLQRSVEDPDTVDFLRRYLGSALFGRQVEQIFIFMSGGGGNGKGVITRVLSHVLGAYALIASKKILMDRGSGDDYKLSRWEGRRLILVPEVGTEIGTERLKEITGGDDVEVREIYQPVRQIPATWNLIIAGNRPPSLGGDVSEGLRRRMLVVNFPRRAPAQPGEDGFVPNFEERLRDETSGILNWLLRGFYEWYDAGCRSEPSQRMIEASQRLISDQDHMTAWAEKVDLQCVEGPVEVRSDFRIVTADLYRSVVTYHQFVGERPPAHQAFCAWLRDFGALEANQPVRVRGLLDERDRSQLVRCAVGVRWAHSAVYRLPGDQSRVSWVYHAQTSETTDRSPEF